MTTVAKGSAKTFPAQPVRLGRIPITEVGPLVDGGRWPARAAEGEVVPITAKVFREGHDSVSATAVLVRPDGTDHSRVTMTCTSPGLDTYEAKVQPDTPGRWTFYVEGWDDPVATWKHNARVKVAADQDIDLVFTQGQELYTEASTLWDADAPEAVALGEAVTAMRDTSRPAEARLAVALSDSLTAILARRPLRRYVTRSDAFDLTVMRRLAAASSWYEVFPRSVGATRDHRTGEWTSGNFRSTEALLPYVAGMGFDILYFPPIHPIGTAHRKGPNNTLTAGAYDPGSPYAIGSADGGHDAIHPDLGTMDDFRHLIDAARDQGLEVALDLALQCAPDHPWVTEHPEWFLHRPDGTIAYAENPPKKYQDIYPLYFDTDPEGISQAILEVLEHWIAAGVTVFRVDNPHTKPVWFWEWLIGKVNESHPDIIFLAEAFTRPAMMRTLAKVGFQQSYTYFAWRNTGADLKEYVTELSCGGHEHVYGVTGTADYMRPNFWPTTPDILTPYVQHGTRAAHEIRAILAATMSPSYGIYGGYELIEHVARPGAEEHIDSEKYEYKPRDFEAAERNGQSLAPLLRALNAARQNNPALMQLRSVRFHTTTNDNIIAFSHHLPWEFSDSEANTVLTVVNLDPHGVSEGEVLLNGDFPERFGSHAFAVQDELTGERYTWAQHFYVKLGAGTQAHVARVVHTY